MVTKLEAYKSVFIVKTTKKTFIKKNTDYGMSKNLFPPQ